MDINAVAQAALLRKSRLPMTLSIRTLWDCREPLGAARRPTYDGETSTGARSIMNTSIRATLGLLAIFLVCNCGNDGTQTTTEKSSAFATRAGDNTLHSPQFGLTVQKPEGWFALDYDQLNNLMEAGGEIATSGKDDINVMVEASLKNTYNLFAISQYETGASLENNPNVVALAENISAVPGIKRGKDYFFHAKKLLVQTNQNYIFEDGYKARLIDGIEFDQLDLTLEFAGISAKQSYYAAKYQNFMVVIIQSYKSNEDMEATSGIIDTINLDW